MKRKRKILIADDSAYHRFKVKKLLVDNGFDVFEAVDGVGSIQMYRKVEPGLVITDINMPVMDGIESIEFLKRVNHDVRVIVFSTLDEEKMVMKAMRAGARDYLIKPLQPEKFMEVVNKHFPR